MEEEVSADMRISDVWRRVGRLWAAGLVLFALRLAQNFTGFDPDTGLSRPSLAGVLLAVLLAAAAVYELLRSRRLDRTRAPFTRRFAPPEREVPLLAAGCFLLIAGGGLTAAAGGSGAAGLAAVAAGALAVVSGGALLYLVRTMRTGGQPTVAPLLPAMFFGVFWVLAVYLPAAADPVLARYYLPVLACALAAYAFSLLAGFLRGESSPRGFTPTADLAVLASLAALADSGAAQRLLLGGCVLVLSGFLLLQRETPEQEPAPAEEPTAEGGAR